MNILENIMNTCFLSSEEEAEKEFSAAIANAAENYAYDKAHGESGFSALCTAVEEVRDELGLDADYEMTIASAIDLYLSSHPEIEEEAARLQFA